MRPFYRVLLVMGLGMRFGAIGFAIGAASVLAGVSDTLAFWPWVGATAGAARALAMGVWVDDDGLRVRNPWRTQRVRWSEVEMVWSHRPQQPEMGFGGLVPDLKLTDGRRVRLHPLLLVGPWSGPWGRYNTYLSDTIQGWRSDYGVPVAAFSKRRW